MKTNSWLKISALTLAIGVAFGALGAHAFKDIFNNQQLEWWNKGVFYQLIHGLGILLICLVSLTKPSLNLKWCLTLMLIGILFFSGSLYLIAINKGLLGDISFIKYAMIPITPIGGFCFIISWVLLFLKIK
jgi:uncharacterized membrane protein YgdD (TMEM256/DUF423 family)